MAEVQCSAGKYFSAFTCLECPVDTFTSSPGALSCEDCELGKYTDGRNSSTVCGVCNAGEEMTGEIGSRECAQCDSGKFSTSGVRLLGDLTQGQDRMRAVQKGYLE